MNRVVKILMDRDGMSQEDAEALVKETVDEIMMAEDPNEVDDILQDYLGLEPDYLMDIM